MCERRNASLLQDFFLGELGRHLRDVGVLHNTLRRGDVGRRGLKVRHRGLQLLLDGAELALTPYQFTLLLALAERAGRVLSRDALMDLMKGEKLEAFDRSVDVHISRIRAAIEDDPKKPRRILTIRGAGYVFAKDQDR